MPHTWCYTICWFWRKPRNFFGRKVEFFGGSFHRLSITHHIFKLCAGGWSLAPKSSHIVQMYVFLYFCVHICVFVFLDLWYFSTLWVYEGSIALHSSHVRLQKSPSIKQQRQCQATTHHFVFLYIIKCKKGHSLSSL